ncbi:DUF3040 domain-containing protein [Corynebacterium meridianum]|uniref:DUF3040 domain-containing protein n=1 Tax=Corynebacterium meridianum TaxID=2765363 RepID=A0A934I8N0_9CORY|nr:DUF3040 domain-containing protein [Corynebacterium meridianum]MBI8989298.1 DUF3040 domain-containing protein [Corynebacterium meridianum]MCK7676931.1 DUF3040 domain-containing protein [Corynebacterium meridianum]
MSLSEQEQRMFREIEESLMSDPKFGAGLGAGVSAESRRPAISLRGIAIGAVGLLLLIGGVALSLQSLWFVALSVLGFLVMFGAGVWMLNGGDSSDGLDLDFSGGPSRRTRLGGSGGSGFGLGSAMEERFRKRFED